MRGIMIVLEIIVRSAATTSALVLAASVSRAASASGISRAFAGMLCAGTAVYTACSGSPTPGSLWLLVPTALLSGGIPFFFWGWTRSVMDDEFCMTIGPLLAGLALMGITVLLAITANATARSWGIATHSLLGLAFLVIALSEVLQGWRADLIESRRRLRLIVLVIAGGYSSAVLLVELFLRAQSPAAALQLMNALLLMLLLFGLACAMLSPSPTVREAFGWNPAIQPVPARPADIAVIDPDRPFVAKLERFMSTEAVYRDPQITVTALARRVGVSEKRLRALINQRLGHKNFASFVNAFRLEEVRLRLGDSRHDHLPILTLALDAGFGSVVAFNRAFKGKYGLTPSEYRANRDGSEA
jgi:AraC-like DNA-binding protein